MTSTEEEATDHTFEVDESTHGTRLDVFLTAHFPDITRSQLRQHIQAGNVSVAGKAATKPGTKIREGEAIVMALVKPATIEAVPQNIPLTILHEDDDLIVLVKPAGMVVHPAPGHPDGTLVNAILYHSASLSSVNDEQDPLRPGIVHRLDKDTSGVMVVCKSNKAHAGLAAQFADHSIERRYLAIARVGTRLEAQGTFDSGHGRHPNHRMRYTGRVDSRRRAITHFRVLKALKQDYALMACTLETGRTHQIRMHLAEAGAPILGDELYGKGATNFMSRQALHAELLGFNHPISGEFVRFRAPAPQDFVDALNHLRP